MSKQDYEDEESFFSANSGSSRKNFFDFDDDEEDTFVQTLNESVNNKVQSPKSPQATTKKPVLNYAISAESPSQANNQNLLPEFKLDDADGKVSELISSLSIIKTPSSANTISGLSPRLAIEKIVSGEHDTNISAFHGKEQKLELLDYALLTGNSYAITKVICFLQETLKPSIYHNEILRRPVASDHYLVYLRNSEQMDKLLDTLVMLGRHEEAAFAMYSRAIKSGLSCENQIKQLRKALLNFTSGGPEVLQWQTYIKDQISLLEQQLPIEADDKRRETEEISRLQELTPNRQSSFDSQHSSSTLFVMFPRPQLTGLPVLETLHYCCRYHYNLPDKNFASPEYIKKKFALTEKQFLWTALQALSKNGNWPEIDNLFEYKSWLGSRKIKTCIPTDEILSVLYKSAAPSEVLEKYLELVDDVERRLQLAKDFLMTKFAADILIKLRDRKRLSELQTSVQTTQEVDYVQRYIANTLKTSTIKWKN